MPEIRRGSLQIPSDTALGSTPRSPTSPLAPPLSPTHTTSAAVPISTSSLPTSPAGPAPPAPPISLNHVASPISLDGLASPQSRSQVQFPLGTRAPLKKHRSDRSAGSGHSADAPRKSLSYALRPEAQAYYDSRAASRKEFKRRAQTLEEYYDDNPNLLPQLPFTWHHGLKRWRLVLFAVLVFIDASLIPIALYYAMFYAGNVPGWIIFAVVTTIWGGPTYLEFAIRTLRLMKKEKFYRPLGTDSRWCFDLLNWASTLTIFVVTALFIIGSAPHDVWLRVLCMPAPAILYCLGGVLAALTLYHDLKWKAPFRISSTAKGEVVLPGAYYFVEDTVAVNARGGRPYREAFAARYKASPRFRRMLWVQSWFWAIPSLFVAAVLTVVATIDPIPATVAYGICWAVPFIWATIWGVCTVYMCKRDMRNERLEWQASEEKTAVTPPTTAVPTTTPPANVVPADKTPTVATPTGRERETEIPGVTQPQNAVTAAV